MPDVNEKVCGNCMYFGRSRKGVGGGDITDKDTSRSDTADKYRICGAIEHLPYNKPESLLQPSSPYVTDESGYYAALRVPADFGCVLWEPNEAALKRQQSGATLAALQFGGDL